jgi:hypothetical protein
VFGGDPEPIKLKPEERTEADTVYDQWGLSIDGYSVCDAQMYTPPSRTGIGDSGQIILCSASDHLIPQLNSVRAGRRVPSLSGRKARGGAEWRCVDFEMGQSGGAFLLGTADMRFDESWIKPHQNS